MDEQTRKDVISAVVEILNGAMSYESDRVNADMQDEYDGWVTMILQVKI